MTQQAKKKLRWYCKPAWDDLPEWMRVSEVRPYYDTLYRHGLALKAKRLLDTIFSFLLLLILLIPMAVIAVLIRCDSEGPVFYRQERVTTYGKRFRIHKFRTMVANADKIGTAVTVSGDSRITKVGAKLRNLRLDELPQVLDVLAGTMSFVGTRPEAVKYVKAYTPEMRATLLLPAGITSEASIRYMDEAELLDKAENADEVYIKQVLPAKMVWNLRSIRKFSLMNEIRTVFRTIAAVLGKECN